MGAAAWPRGAYRIAFNASIDTLRRRQRRPLSSIELPDFPAGASMADGVVDRADIDAALGRLPVEYRGPVVLRDLCGLDYAEIGEVLGIPAGTVRSRIWRGRAMLATMLRPAGSEP